MPIVIDVVSKEDFAKWVASKKKEAGIDTAKTPEKPADKQDGKSSDKPSSNNKTKAKN